VITSFLNNLIASLNGWGSPATPILFGPLRNWDKPKIFRSNSVIKATLIKIGIMEKRKDKIIKKKEN
jgi:hypothetical protein